MIGLDDGQAKGGVRRYPIRLDDGRVCIDVTR
jgi:hypothetical protein